MRKVQIVLLILIIGIIGFFGWRLYRWNQGTQNPEPAAEDDAGEDFYIELMDQIYTLSAEQDAYEADCIVLAVAHNAYRERTLAQGDAFFKNCPAEGKVIIDIKGILDATEVKKAGYRYWRL